MRVYTVYLPMAVFKIGWSKGGVGMGLLTLPALI